MSSNARTSSRPTAASAPDASHPHHWCITEANGPTSVGVCRICAEVREFKNWIPEGDFTTRAERELAA